MQDWMMVLEGGLALLPIMGGAAILLIAVQVYNLKKMEKQFADCVVRIGVVHDMGVREPTRQRPYRHCVVTCSFQNGSDLVEIPYEGGDLKHIQVGDEIPLYFYPNGVATVVGYDADTVKKKLKQQILLILILCLVMSFLIPTVGFRGMNRIRSY